MQIHLIATFFLCLYLVTEVSPMSYSYGEENGDAVLMCEEDTFRMQWLTPQLRVVNPDGAYDTLKYQFQLNNESVLTVLNLEGSDAGVYACGIPVESSLIHEKSVAKQVQLRVKLPYHDTDYSDNAVTGVVVAVIVAAIFAGVCLVYKYRYREEYPKEEPPEAVKVDPITSNEREDTKKGVENPGMEVDEETIEEKIRDETEGDQSSDKEERSKTQTDGNVAETGM